MPKTSRAENVALSPVETVLDMVASILDKPKMDVHEKLGMLRELCVERISFNLPKQAVKVISMLAEIISADPDPEVRVAALEAMERMIGLEEKAEAEEGRPAIDWRTVTVLLRKAKKQTELDTMEVASRAGPPSPETPMPLPASAFAVSDDEAPPEAHATSRDDGNGGPAEAMLLAVQEDAVAAIKQADVAAVPPLTEMLGAEPALAPVAQRSQPVTPTVEEKPEPPIMKFLRSVSGDGEEENHIRELAHRIISRIETLTAPKPSMAVKPALKEG